MTIRTIALAAAVATLLSFGPASAQTMGWPEASSVQTQLYFGLRTTDGTGVSEQEWAQFIFDVVTPRFPEGLTVLNAYGQGRSTPKTGAPIMFSETTKLLILIHPNTADEAAKIEAIKAEYNKRFNQDSVFHVDFPARLVK